MDRLYLRPMAASRNRKMTTGDEPILWLVHPGAGESTRAAELAALGYRVVGGPGAAR
jgi:hypothetical protein